MVVIQTSVILFTAIAIIVFVLMLVFLFAKYGQVFGISIGLGL